MDKSKATPPRNKMKLGKASMIAPASLKKGKEVKVKHVAMKKGGTPKGKKGC